MEEYLEGPEVTVSGFSLAGEYVPLVVTDRVCAEPPAFGVPLSETWPSPHAQASAEVARRAVEALGIADGSVARTRCASAAAAPRCSQVSARLGADHEAELVELVTGVDLNRLALAAALGWPLEAEDDAAPRRARRPGAATTRFLRRSARGARVGRAARRDSTGS